MAETGTIRTGCAGWIFEPWRGEFYPKGLPQKQELNYASRHVRTIEINATFYRNQTLASYTNWAGETPEGFVFSLKGPQLITHIKRLRDVETTLANFLASGVLSLGPKLGPLVWQLPPHLHFDAERIESFFALLPQTPDDAAKLASQHDERLKSEPFVTADAVKTVRHAMEVRHESYRNPEFIALLRKYNVALVAADTADWPLLDLTADFAYGRLQGPPGGEKYSEAELDAWATRAQAWADGRITQDPAFPGLPQPEPKPRDVFLYFVHTDKVHAPANAMAIMQRLSLEAYA
jgi:uncharacterized protein YecE (DUF72 family)